MGRGRPKKSEGKLISRVAFLSPLQVGKLEERSRILKISVSQIIRESIDHYLNLPISWDNRVWNPSSKDKL